MRRFLVLCLLAVFPASALNATRSEAPVPKTPREALQAFNDLIGSWKATGIPEGSRDEKQKGFWEETQNWSWQFKGDDAWLRLSIEKGKYFTQGELRYLPEKEQFQLTLQTVGKENLSFVGTLQEKRLNLERTDDSKEVQRLAVALLHSNRIVFRYEVQKPGRTTFTRLYQVGATKEGEPFASGQVGPECIVSGGLGTMPVNYKGKTYYVCCSGCRDAFKDNPEKFIKEFEERKAKKP